MAQLDADLHRAQRTLERMVEELQVLRRQLASDPGLLGRADPLGVDRQLQVHGEDLEDVLAWIESVMLPPPGLSSDPQLPIGG